MFFSSSKFFSNNSPGLVERKGDGEGGGFITNAGVDAGAVIAIVRTITWRRVKLPQPDGRLLFGFNQTLYLNKTGWV